MLSSRKKTFSDGFSLIELLVVIVILGLVITSVYSLYLSSKFTANTSEEVVDVQQNLRMALDTLVTDIRMAGFLVVNDQPAILNAPDVIWKDTDGNGLKDAGEGDVFEIQSSASVKSFARVVGVSGDTLVVEPGMEVNFRKGDNLALISPGPATFKKKSATEFFIITGDPTKGVPQLQLDSSVATIAKINDIIVVKSTTEEDVAQIRYWLSPIPDGGSNNFQLMRTDDSGPNIIATNITELDLTYIMDDGTEDSAPANPQAISAIRIDITGETDNTRTGADNYSGVKGRSLQSIVKLRNSFED
jgi:prepilin-type N-terminal cleavage/methylation domain-containing protein